MTADTISRSLTARLETQLDALHTILAGAPPQLLATRSPSGAWSAHEHLAHLARHHDVFLARLHRIVAEDRPVFTRYRAEDDSEWPSWSALPTAEVLSRLQHLRARISQWVADLEHADASRLGVHPLFGAQSVSDMLEFFLLHEAHHLYVAMVRLGEARKVPIG